MKIKCPKCFQEYDIPKEYIDKELQCEQCEECFTINSNGKLVDKQQLSEREFIETLENGLVFYDKGEGNILLKAEELGKKYFEQYGDKLYKNALLKVESFKNITERIADCSLKDILLRIIEIPINHKDYHNSLNINKIEKYIKLIVKFKKQKIWQGWFSFFCIWLLLNCLYLDLINFCR
jgi:hypothetical protein